MNDYKELIKRLQGSVAHMERFGILTSVVAREEIKTVADAIEQLVKYAQKCERECKLAENLIARLKRERDAARAEIDAATIRGNY